MFAAYGLNTYWEACCSFNLIKGGKGYYGRQTSTSSASPILLGSVALLLQMDPELTATQVRQYIHESAIFDSDTGSTPNQNWGAGKLNVLGAADAVAATIPADPAVNTKSVTFPSQKVGTTSATKTVTLSNSGSAALGITSIAATGDFSVPNNTCGTSLAAGAHCTISVDFHPAKTGTRTSTLTIKDFNKNSPQAVQLTGTGT